MSSMVFASVSLLTLYFRKTIDDYNYLIKLDKDYLLEVIGGGSLSAAFFSLWVAVENGGPTPSRNYEALNFVIKFLITYFVIDRYLSAFGDISRRQRERVQSETVKGDQQRVRLKLLRRNLRESAVITRQSIDVELITVSNLKNEGAPVHSIDDDSFINRYEAGRYRLLLCTWCKFKKLLDNAGWIWELRLKSIHLITGSVDRLTSVQIVYPHLSYIYMHKCMTKGRRWFILYTMKEFAANAVPIKRLTVVTYGKGDDFNQSTIDHFHLPAPTCLHHSWNRSLFKRYFMTVTSDDRLIICMKKYSNINSDEGYLFEFVKNASRNEYEIRREFETKLNFDEPSGQYKDVVCFRDSLFLVMMDLTELKTTKFPLRTLSDHVTLPENFPRELFYFPESLRVNDFRIYRYRIRVERLKRIAAKAALNRFIPDLFEFAKSDVLQMGLPVDIVDEMCSKTALQVAKIEEKGSKNRLYYCSIVVAFVVNLFSGLYCYFK